MRVSFLSNRLRFYLHICYNLHFQTADNAISNDLRFKKHDIIVYV